MPKQEQQVHLIEALVDSASAWREPDYLPRAEVVDRLLGSGYPFTEEALAFAINQQMHQLTVERITAWVGDGVTKHPKNVGLWLEEAFPLERLYDVVAVLATGHHLVGVFEDTVPALLQAFIEEVCSRVPAVRVPFRTVAQANGKVEALFAPAALGDEEAWSQRVGLEKDCCFLWKPRYSVAVLDGQETAAERECLAEDVLLYEGRGSQSAVLLWAPVGCAPDTYLEAFAHFRSVFPVYEKIPGTLKMQQALLKASNQPHAYGEGLEFLMSKGPPTVQPPGHVRWAEYNDLQVVYDWIERHAGEIYQVLIRSPERWDQEQSVKRVKLGNAHRPELEEGRATALLFLLASL